MESKCKEFPKYFEMQVKDLVYDGPPKNLQDQRKGIFGHCIF